MVYNPVTFKGRLAGIVHETDGRWNRLAGSEKEVEITASVWRVRRRVLSVAEA